MIGVWERDQEMIKKLGFSGNAHKDTEHMQWFQLIVID